MSLRSPIARVLGLGSAGDGPSHWWAQRVSAVALGLLALWFLVSLSGMDLTRHAELVAWLSTPMNAVLATLLVAVTAYHSNLGVQEIIVDYVGGWLRIASLVLLQFAHVVIAAVGIVAILRVAFGGGS